jgi:thiol:disulfide interchange protein
VLNESSYLTAISIYVGSAVVMLVYLAWWLGRYWRAGWVALVVLVLAALLLTPAYPKAGVQTMAPALVVAAFLMSTVGVEAANHALRPLIFMSGAAVVLALLLGMTVFRRRRTKPVRQARTGTPPQPRSKPQRSPQSRPGARRADHARRTSVRRDV